PSDNDAEGGPVTAVYWYQGESDSSEYSLRGNFSEYTADVFSAFESHFATEAGEPIILFAQLAPYGSKSGEAPHNAIAKDLQQMDIAERQRRMESGAFAGTSSLFPPEPLATARANTHMVVTNDLPRSDEIHVSAVA